MERGYPMNGKYDVPMVCDSCKKEVETVFHVSVKGRGDRWVCAACYVEVDDIQLRMTLAEEESDE